MAMLRARWRFFWSQRSARRTGLAFVLALVALVTGIYLALPVDAQRHVADGLSTLTQNISAVGFGPILTVITVLCFIVSLALIVIPSHRKHSYLATAPSLILPVSVYLDAENQISAGDIRRFTQFLMEHLDGRRANLFYFLDASATANSAKYQDLYRFGFRLVDVPHDPTGEGAVKEAVDREIDMHAYERALLGPPGQEFIIVTGDGDFVPLAYRLAALGHRVQIWATPLAASYRALATYIDVRVLDLTRILRELPDVAEGEETLYRAIKDTLRARDRVAHMRQNAEQKRAKFYGQVTGPLAPTLASVGYSGGQFRDCWIEILAALGVVQIDKGNSLPQSGTVKAEEAARLFYAIVCAAAQAAERLAAAHDEGIISTDAVAAELASHVSDIDTDDTARLRRFLRDQESRRRIHTRYFLRCAREFRLISFEDVSMAEDTIKVSSAPSPTASTS